MLGEQLLALMQSRGAAGGAGGGVGAEEEDDEDALEAEEASCFHRPQCRPGERAGSLLAAAGACAVPPSGANGASWPALTHLPLPKAPCAACCMAETAARCLARLLQCLRLALCLQAASFLTEADADALLDELDFLQGQLGKQQQVGRPPRPCSSASRAGSSAAGAVRTSAACGHVPLGAGRAAGCGRGLAGWLLLAHAAVALAGLRTPAQPRSCRCRARPAEYP